MKKHIFLLSSFFILLSLSAAAHVRYVIDTAAPASSARTFSDLMLALSPIERLGGLLLIVFFLFLAYEFFHFQRSAAWQRCARHLSSLSPAVPIILRCALAIVLFAAAAGGHLFTPDVPLDIPFFFWLQIVFALFLVFGIFIRTTTLLLVLLFLGSWYFFPYLAGHLDLLGVAFFLVLHEGGLWSTSNIFRIPVEKLLTFLLKKYFSYDAFVLRIFAGLSLVYLALGEKLLQPGLAIAVVEKYQFTSAIPLSPEAWVLLAGSIELVAGILLFFGFLTRFVSVGMLLVLVLGLWFFQEHVLAHLLQIGFLIALIILGGKAGSIDERCKLGHTGHRKE